MLITAGILYIVGEYMMELIVYDTEEPMSQNALTGFALIITFIVSMLP